MSESANLQGVVLLEYMHLNVVLWSLPAGGYEGQAWGVVEVFVDWQRRVGQWVNAHSEALTEIYQDNRHGCRHRSSGSQNPDVALRVGSGVCFTERTGWITSGDQPCAKRQCPTFTSQLTHCNQPELHLEIVGPRCFKFE